MKGATEKKKKPKVRSSTKHERLLKQIAAKEKESAHDKRFDSFEKKLRTSSKNSIEKTPKKKKNNTSPDGEKKEKKRKNVSSKHSLQACLSTEGGNRIDLFDDIEESEQAEEDRKKILQESKEFDFSEQAKRESELQNKIITELKETVWKDRFFEKKSDSANSLLFQEEVPKKNIKKPSIPKVKQYYPWLNWNRTGLTPQSFRSGLELYEEAKLEQDVTYKMIQKSWTFDRLETDQNYFIKPEDPIQIKCCICNDLIIGLAIPIWKGYHCHERCISKFGSND